MSKSTRYLLAMLLVILVCCFLQWKFCCNCNKVSCTKNNKEKAAPTVKKATKKPFIVKDLNGNLSLNTNDNFNFRTSSFSYEVPLTNELENEVIKLKDYLTKNTDKSVNITGYYTSTEENPSLYPNLGIARANAVKSYFTSKGIPSKNINTFGELKTDLQTDQEEIYYGPIGFEVNTSKNNVLDLEKVLSEIKTNPLVLQFKTGEANINLTSDQRAKIFNISKYLDKVDGAVCLIVGHTDNKGNANANVKLGQERADFAKNLLVNNGISATKIETSSQGPYKPIATNKTEEGRAKNRRTVITIK